MSKYQTEQEDFWAGEFGNDYVERNKDMQRITSNKALFARVFSRLPQTNSLIEFGANIGLNLIAIHELFPHIELSAIEINSEAVTTLKQLQYINTYAESILSFKNEIVWDIVLIKGVLIHINPDSLTNVYDNLYKSSNKYICIAEYYNPTPVSIPYRGHDNKLFKRDFAGEMLDKFPDLRLIDYGFVYHRDNHFPQDDLTWFLLEKSGVK